MNSDDDIGKGITPISRGMVYQKLSSPREIEDIDEKKFKKYDINLNGRTIQILYDGDDGVVIDGKLYKTSVMELEDNSFLAKVEINKKQIHRYKINHSDGQIYLEGRKTLFNFQPSIPKLSRKRSAKAGGEEIRAPLPGNISSVDVHVGDPVETGQRVAILEAMKMQNDLICSISGEVKDIKVKVGDQVNTDQLIMIIGPKKSD
ncbi:MAG: hypothetical protein INQ03_20635 [Candidatus Heimdallarchaeota archaeon]|nr:hypothetical protein [Candidatus Heimdallarchaeota archaeon]